MYNNYFNYSVIITLSIISIFVLLLSVYRLRCDAFGSASKPLDEKKIIEGMDHDTGENIKAINTKFTEKAIISNEIINSINNHSKLLNIYNSESCKPIILKIDGSVIKDELSCRNDIPCFNTPDCHPFEYYYDENAISNMKHNNLYLVFTLNVVPYLIQHDTIISKIINQTIKYPGIRELSSVFNYSYHGDHKNPQNDPTETASLYFLIDWIRYQDYYITEFITKKKTDEIYNIYS